jgi:hypothetical protein
VGSAHRESRDVLTKNPAQQAAWERSAAELRGRLAARDRAEAWQQAEASRPPTLGEAIYGRGPYDGKAAARRSVAAGFA